VALVGVLEQQHCLCGRPPEIGPERINEKKLFFLKFRLFSCFAVDFILRSFLFTHYGIVILTNK